MHAIACLTQNRCRVNPSSGNFYTAMFVKCIGMFRKVALLKISRSSLLVTDLQSAGCNCTKNKLLIFSRCFGNFETFPGTAL